MIKDLPKPFIIADIGSSWRRHRNEQDNLELAKHHIFMAKSCGANAAKFQLYTDNELYGVPGTDTWALPQKWLPELASYCNSQGVEFMCTAFSLWGYEQVDKFVNLHKVASSEMKHLPFMDFLIKTNKPFLISTGGAFIGEVQRLEEYLHEHGAVDRFGFMECHAAYPSLVKQYRLGAAKGAGWKGLSDHTRGHSLALCALGAGFTIFEKHFRAFDDGLVGRRCPDDDVSVGPGEFARYCAELRECSYALYESGEKNAGPCERDMTMRYRRRLKVTHAIQAGETLVYGENYGIYRSIKEDATAGGAQDYKVFDGATALIDLKPQDPVWFSTAKPLVPEAPK